MFAIFSTDLLKIGSGWSWSIGLIGSRKFQEIDGRMTFLAGSPASGGWWRIVNWFLADRPRGGLAQAGPMVRRF
jgi:hypothetical protein